VLRSVWTIDLAHLARSFGLGVEFSSLMLGPNPQYKTAPFYMQHMHVSGGLRLGRAETVACSVAEAAAQGTCVRACERN